MSKESIFEAKGLSLTYSGKTILEGVDFSAKMGEVIVIIGPNGGGKSSLIKIIAGVIQNYQGTVMRKEPLKLSYMPQLFTMNPHLPISVSQFITLKCKNDASLAWVIELLQLKEIWNSLMNRLSGGEIKRALLARCLLNAPELLILDEPTEHMDISAKNEFYNIISRIHKALGCAIIMASHDLYVVMKGTNRVICMKGSILCEGNAQTLVQNKEFIEIFGKNVNFYKHRH